MKSFFLLPVVIILTLLLTPACSRPGISDGNSAWPSSGVAEADSLIMRIDELRNSPLRNGNESVRLAGRFCSVASRYPSNEILQLRQLYVAGCTILRSDQKQAYDYVSQGMARLDSAASPYDWHCVKSLKLPYEKSLYAKYINASDNVKYFSSVGDDMELGRNLMILGNVMCEMDDKTKALEYYARAEECFRRHNATQELYMTQINRANASGYDEGGRILEELLNDSIVQNNKAAYALVLQNGYLRFDSVELLDRAIGILENESIDNGNLPLLLSLRAYELLNDGRPEDALRLATRIRHAGNGKKLSGRYLDIIHSCLAEIYHQNGMKDSCISELNRVILVGESIQAENNLPAIYSHETKKLIDIAQRNASLEKKEMIMWWVVSLLALLLVTVWIYLTARRRQIERKHQLEILDGKIENGRQVQLVMTNILEESDRMIADINSVLKTYGKGSAAADNGMAEEIRRIMAIYQSNGENRRGYVKINRDLDSRFTMRLKEDFPDLSENLLRLAALIAAGVDSHQLSAILNISPKSLYTSRYRLRGRLGLSKDDSLEDFLRRYSLPE